MKAGSYVFRKRKTLNDKLRTLGLILVLIVGCVCTSIFTYVELVHQRKMIHQQLEQTIMLQQQYIDSWLSDRMSDMNVIANFPAVKRGSADQSKELIELMLSKHSEFRSIGFIGTDGRTTDGIYVGDRPYFQAAKQGEFSISDVLKSRIDNKRIIVFASPVFGDEHLFKGAVAGVVELTTIERLMQQFSYGKQGQTYLVDKEGTLITGEGISAEQPLKVDPAILKQAEAGNETMQSYHNYLGVKVYGAYQWTKGGRWLIIGEAAKKDVLASLYTELKYASLFIVLAMLAAVLIMLRTAKRIAMPVNQLLRGVRIIKGGDYHYRIDPGALMSSTIEFQQLGLSFNSMSDTILEHTEALRAERNFASSIIETAASLIVVLDQHGNILRFNRSCELATGYLFEEVRGMSIYEKLIPKADVEHVQANFHSLLALGGSTSSENHWRSRSGELRLIAWSNTILKDSGLESAHIIGIGIDITEQRKMERALRESEERFRLIVGSMDEVVSTFDSELQLTGVYGRAMDENDPASYEGKTIQGLLDPANARLHEDAQLQALQEKTSVIDWSIERPQGMLHYYQTSYSTLRDNEGEILGVVSVSRDITPLKEAEEAYWESQARINNILESITDAFMSLNDDWTFAYVNSEAERMLGKSRSEIMGKSLGEVFPKIMATPLYQAYRKVMEEQVPLSTEEYIPFKKAWYEVHVYPSKNGLSIYFQDVSVRKELEQAATDSRIRLSTIIETVPSGIIVVDENGLISLTNRMAEEIIGMDKEFLVNRPYDYSEWVLYDYDGIPIEREAYPVTIAIRTRQAVFNSEILCLKPDGARTIISCNCSPVLGGQGNVVSVLVSLSDITGRITIQNELQAANDELKRLSSLDGLTGVYNRRYFNEQLHEEWDKRALLQEPLSLIMVDIDYFKAYNDTYGHLGGDMCLKTVASLVQASLVVPDWFIARYGGEEFGIVLPGTPVHEAAALAETLRTRIEREEISHVRSKVGRFLTISLGVATTVPIPGQAAESLVSAADRCLYEAKRTRNRVVVSGSEARGDRLQQEADFRGL